MNWFKGNRYGGVMLAWGLISLGLIAFTLLAAYGVALEENRVRLAESSRTYAQLIEAVARFDSKFSSQDHPQGSWGATYSQVLDALRMSRNKEFYGQMGIVHLVRQDLVMISNVSGPLATERIVQVDDPLFEVFHKGLAGKDGDFYGEDHLGNTVLLAYYPVPAMELLVVVGVPVWRIQQPFIHAGLVAFAAGFLLMAGGLAVSVGWSRRRAPLPVAAGFGVRDMVNFSDEALVLLDEGKQVMVVNPVAEILLGQEASRLTGLPWDGLFSEATSALSGGGNGLVLPVSGEKVEVVVRREGIDAIPVMIDAIRFDQDEDAYHLLRITRGSAANQSSGADREPAREGEVSAKVHSLTAQVRELIIAGLPGGDAAVKIIAPKLGMSVRSLQRQLGEEGVSFSSLLNQTRQELCLRYLDQGRLGLEDIASKLGYSDLTNFHRAFKRWTGLTPGRYRRRVTNLRTHQRESADGSEVPRI